MKLNAKKCKGMQICFLNEISEPIRLRIASHKVLSLVIQNNLKWNKHIDTIVIKASKASSPKFRVLSRGGVEIEDLVTVYVVLIRSVLEYRPLS